MSFKFFRVEALPLKPGRKTREYSVLTRAQGAEIGRIGWYGPWRKFCFFPGPDTVWDAVCLVDISRALALAAADREAER